MIMQGSKYEVNSIQVFSLTTLNIYSDYDCWFISMEGDLGVLIITVDKKIVREFPGKALGSKEFVKMEVSIGILKSYSDKVLCCLIERSYYFNTGIYFPIILSQEYFSALVFPFFPISFLKS